MIESKRLVHNIPDKKGIVRSVSRENVLCIDAKGRLLQKGALRSLPLLLSSNDWKPRRAFSDTLQCIPRFCQKKNMNPCITGKPKWLRLSLTKLLYVSGLGYGMIFISAVLTLLHMYHRLVYTIVSPNCCMFQVWVIE